MLRLHQQISEYRQGFYDFPSPDVFGDLEVLLEDCQLATLEANRLSSKEHPILKKLNNDSVQLFAPLGDLRNYHIRQHLERMLLIRAVEASQLGGALLELRPMFEDSIRLCNLLSISTESIVDSLMPSISSNDTLTRITAQLSLLRATKSLAAYDDMPTLSPESKKQVQRHVYRILGRITELNSFTGLIKEIPCVDSESSSTESKA